MSAVERPAEGPDTEHGQPTITVSAEWVHRLFESAQYTICVPPIALEVEWLVRDLHGRLTRLLHERSELENRLTEVRSETAALRDAAPTPALTTARARLLGAVDEILAQYPQGKRPSDPYVARLAAARADVRRELDAWRSAAGSATTAARHEQRDPVEDTVVIMVDRTERRLPRVPGTGVELREMLGVAADWHLWWCRDTRDRRVQDWELAAQGIDITGADVFSFTAPGRINASAADPGDDVPRHEVECPGCGTTIRARMADAPTGVYPPAIDESDMERARRIAARAEDLPEFNDVTCDLIEALYEEVMRLRPSAAAMRVTGNALASAAEWVAVAGEPRDWRALNARVADWRSVADPADADGSDRA